jgi:hypothetical protein
VSEAAILEAVRRGLITPEQARERLKPTQPKERQTSLGEVGVRTFAQGITLGAADEIASGLGAAFDRTVGGKPLAQAYSDRLTANRAQDALGRKQRPVTATLSNIAGGVVLAGGAGAAAPASTLLNPATAGQLARTGAFYGGAQGALSGEGIEGRILGGAGGAAIGAATGYATSKVLDRVLPNKAPSIDDLKADYRTTKEALKGVKVDPTRLIGDVVKPTAESLRFVRGQYDPKLDAALNNLVNVSRNRPNAFAIDEIRGRLPADKDGMALRETLDSFLEGQNVSPVFRDSYRRAMLADKMQNAIDRGASSPASMRTMLTNIAKSKGVKSFEREAILKAAKAPTKVGNLSGAVLSLAMPGPVGTATGYVGGRLFDAAAENASANAAKNAFAAILRGQRMPSYAERLGALVGLKK